MHMKALVIGLILAAPLGAAQEQPSEPLATPGAPAVALPTDIVDGPVVAALKAGEFEKALRLTDLALRSSTGTLSRDLYLRGLAQLGKAQASGEAAEYKDAGLSFMRVIAYFPQSRYAAASWMEVGFVHQKIGRPDLAVRLYDRAAAMLDPETDPVLSDRLASLQQSLPDAKQLPATSE